MGGYYETWSLGAPYVAMALLVIHGMARLCAWIDAGSPRFRASEDVAGYHIISLLIFLALVFLLGGRSADGRRPHRDLPAARVMTLIHTLGLLAVLVLLSLALSGLLSKAPDLRVLRDPRVVEVNAHSAFMVSSGACGHGRKGTETRRDCDCATWREK